MFCRYPVFRNIKGFVVAGRENQAKKWLSSGFAELFMCPQEQIFIRNSPGAVKVSLQEIIFFDDRLETTVEEKTLHIVDMRGASI